MGGTRKDDDDDNNLWRWTVVHCHYHCEGSFQGALELFLFLAPILGYGDDDALVSLGGNGRVASRGFRLFCVVVQYSTGAKESDNLHVDGVDKEDKFDVRLPVVTISTTKRGSGWQSKKSTTCSWHRRRRRRSACSFELRRESEPCERLVGVLTASQDVIIDSKE
eukprot:scaffold482_cov266-Amphora_coffeaeformis.AAC.68